MDFPITAETARAIVENPDLMDGETYDALYAYYTNPALGSDAMPYGTAKARDGDPDLWIHRALYREFGTVALAH